MIEATVEFWLIYFGIFAVLVVGAVWVEFGGQELNESRAKFNAELIKFLNKEDAP